MESGEDFTRMEAELKGRLAMLSIAFIAKALAFTHQDFELIQLQRIRPFFVHLFRLHLARRREFNIEYAC